MTEGVAALLVLAGEAYLAVGCVFAVPFVLWGAGQLDPSARRATWGFRLLILPGTAALWPLLALRWVRGEGRPEPRDPHRAAALEEDDL